MDKVPFREEKMRLILDYALAALGAFVTAAAFSFFFLPNSLAPGGVTGVAEVVSHFTALPVGLLSFLFNVPLFLLGWRRVGWRFALRSFIAMTLLSAFIDLLPVRDLAGDMLLAALFGGALMGVGLGLVVRAGATTGGTDMAAGMLHERMPFLSIPAIMFIIDGMVISAAALCFGFRAGLLALLACFVSAKAMDAVIKGFNTAMQFLIFTREKETIRERILYEMDRGATELSARGAYSGAEVGALLCVIPRMEAARLKKIVREADPDAFVTVCDVHEVLGEGFTPEAGIRKTANGGSAALLHEGKAPRK